MGRDKAFLPFGEETLLSRSLRLARAVTESVSIVGDTKKFASFAPVVEDAYRDRGPLGGIHAALSTTSAEHNLIMAVDLPFLNLRFLQYLIAQAQIPEYQVRFRWQPNSVAFWDNRSTQHYAVMDYPPCNRKMERAGIIGDTPF